MVLSIKGDEVSVCSPKSGSNGIPEAKPGLLGTQRKSCWGQAQVLALRVKNKQNKNTPPKKKKNPLKRSAEASLVSAVDLGLLEGRTFLHKRLLCTGSMKAIFINTAVLSGTF